MRPIARRISHPLRIFPRSLRGQLPAPRSQVRCIQAAIHTQPQHAFHQNDGDSTHTSSKRSNIGLAFLALAGYLLLKRQDDGEAAHCCGIVGVVGEKEASNFLLEGLTILRNRGYDSAGIASVSDEGGDVCVTKYASLKSTSDSIDLVKQNASKHAGHSTGIGHTRWATHGGKTDQNAHPHVDYLKRIAVVHNGTINNSYELRKELQASGIPFKSETDTEVIAQLIGTYLDEGCGIKEAVDKALMKCEGSWGLAVVSKSTPEEVIVACNGSPMVIGLGQGKTFIASETSAFSRYTKNFIAMKDGEIGVVRADGTTLDVRRVEKAAENDVLLTPHPHPHFTIKECLEQPEAIARALNFGARMNEKSVVLGGLQIHQSALEHIKNLIITGCGTSKHAGDFAAKLMRDLDCLDSVSVLDSAEMRQSDVPKRCGGVLAVSQSGETKDVHRAVKLGEDGAVPCLSVVNVVGSLIARTTGIGVYLNAGREHAVASTKAFTSQVTVLSLIALWFRQMREARDSLPASAKRREMLEALQRLPISFGMANQTRAQCKRIASQLCDKSSLFVLGKGYGEPIAHEGALKIKEMCYLHAEGYSGGALKHGPFALIEGPEGKDGRTPIIMLILNDDHASHMRTAAEEVKARGAQLHIITDNPRLAQGLDEDPVVIPNNGPLTALIAVLPLQLIAYELAVMRGINPDVPRNLAKAVTTD